MATEETNARPDPDPDHEWRITDPQNTAYRIFDIGFGEGACRVVLNVQDRPVPSGPPQVWEWSARATFENDPNRGTQRIGQTATAAGAMRSADAAWPEMLVEETIKIKQRADREEARARQKAEVRATLLAAMRLVNAENAEASAPSAPAAPEG